MKPAVRFLNYLELENPTQRCTVEDKKLCYLYDPDNCFEDVLVYPAHDVITFSPSRKCKFSTSQPTSASIH